MPNRFELTVLGTNSSYPANDRMLSSQVLTIGSNKYLIDCGEGTQMQLAKFKIKRTSIGAIFISHLHGDHLYGLPGLITSFSHFERTQPLTIYGPVGIKRYLDTTFDISQARIGFKLTIHETDTEVSKAIFEDNRVTVFNFPLSHRIPTQGFVFEEKVPYLPIIAAKIEEYGLDYNEIRILKKGVSVHRESGMTILPEHVCNPKPKARKYVYMSDTSYLNQFPDVCKNADLLYHETTYLDALQEIALERGHSTSMEAARVAKNLNADRLLFGHFSSRYKDVSEFETECRTIFPNSHAAVEGKTYEINI